MLQADISALEHRQQFLEREIFEALRHTALDEPMLRRHLQLPNSRK